MLDILLSQQEQLDCRAQSNLPLNPAFPQHPATTMSSDRNLVTTEARGTSYGTFFNDLALIDDIENAAISRILVGHAAYITSLTVRRPANKRRDRGLTLAIAGLL